MSEETWKKEMGVRAKKDPLDLQSLPYAFFLLILNIELKFRFVVQKRCPKSYVHDLQIENALRNLGV